MIVPSCQRVSGSLLVLTSAMKSTFGLTSTMKCTILHKVQVYNTAENTDPLLGGRGEIKEA